MKMFGKDTSWTSKRYWYYWLWYCILVYIRSSGQWFQWIGLVDCSSYNSESVCVRVCRGYLWPLPVFYLLSTTEATGSAACDHRLYKTGTGNSRNRMCMIRVIWHYVTPHGHAILLSVDRTYFSPSIVYDLSTRRCRPWVKKRSLLLL